jgi:hypothetical protein
MRFELILAVRTVLSFNRDEVILCALPLPTQPVGHYNLRHQSSTHMRVDGIGYVRIRLALVLYGFLSIRDRNSVSVSHFVGVNTLMCRVCTYINTYTF